MSYTSSKCGRCNFEFKFEHGIDYFTHEIGSPIIKCVNCDGLNSTKKKFYSNLTTFEKGKFYLGEFITFSVLVIFLPFIAYAMVISTENFVIKTIVTLFAFILIIFKIITLFKLPKEFNRMELAFLKNENETGTGFLWSDDRHKLKVFSIWKSKKDKRKYKGMSEEEYNEAVRIPDDVKKDFIDRDQAIKRIKEVKDLFDTGILSQEEYDKLVAKYKAIIMAN